MSQIDVHAITCGRWKASFCTCGIDAQELQVPPTEMTSLREIKAKLDAVLAGLDKQTKIDCELLQTFADWLKKADAKLDALLQSHSALGDGLSFVRGDVGLLNGKLDGIRDGLCDEISQVRRYIENFKVVRPKQKRRRKP